MDFGPSDAMTAAPFVAVHTVATPGHTSDACDRHKAHLHSLVCGHDASGLASPFLGRRRQLSSDRLWNDWSGLTFAGREVRSAATPTADARLAIQKRAGRTRESVLSMRRSEPWRRRSPGAAHGLRQTSLRPAMSVHDARFVGNGAATGTAGIVGTLVRIAEQRGRVLVAREWATALRTRSSRWGGPVSAPMENPASGDQFRPVAGTRNTSPGGRSPPSPMSSPRLRPGWSAPPMNLHEFCRSEHRSSHRSPRILGGRPPLLPHYSDPLAWTFFHCLNRYLRAYSSSTAPVA